VKSKVRKSQSLKRNGIFNIDSCVLLQTISTQVFSSLSLKGMGIQPLTPSLLYSPDPLPSSPKGTQTPDPSSLNTICYCIHLEKAKMVQAPLQPAILPLLNMNLRSNSPPGSRWRNATGYPGKSHANHRHLQSLCRTNGFLLA